MHCCRGNHILETHQYWSLFAFADEHWRQGGLDLLGQVPLGNWEERESEHRRRGGPRDGVGRRERGRWEEGQDSTGNPAASQRDPEFSGLWPEEKEAPRARCGHVPASGVKRPELGPQAVSSS